MGHVSKMTHDATGNKSQTVAISATPNFATQAAHGHKANDNHPNVNASGYYMTQPEHERVRAPWGS
jgi:hypothetical protein